MTEDKQEGEEEEVEVLGGWRVKHRYCLLSVGPLSG